jgi:hypothetical protein
MKPDLRTAGALLLLVLFLVVPVSAELTNLTQPYVDQLPNSCLYGELGRLLGDANANVECTPQGMLTWENAGSDWQPSYNNSGIIWATYYDLVPPANLSFILTMNSGRQIAGSIVSEDPWPWYSVVTTTLGSVSSTKGVNHLPFIGVLPRYTLAYGIDTAGACYLFLLEQGRTGGEPYSLNGILVDLAVDPSVQVNPPEFDPAIRLETTSTNMFKVWGYSLTADQLKHGEKSGLQGVSTIRMVWDIAWIFFSGGLGFVIGFVIPNLFLVFSVGEGLLALYVLRTKSSIPAAMGAFASINISMFEIVTRIFSYIITGLYEVIQALFKWL